MDVYVCRVSDNSMHFRELFHLPPLYLAICAIQPNEAGAYCLFLKKSHLSSNFFHDFRFICPNTEVFGTASIVWGVIGPAKQFSEGQIY